MACIKDVKNVERQKERERLFDRVNRLADMHKNERDSVISAGCPAATETANENQQCIRGLKTVYARKMTQ